MFQSIVIDIEVLVKERPKLSLYKIWGRKEGGEDHQWEESMVGPWPFLAKYIQYKDTKTCYPIWSLDILWHKIECFILLIHCFCKVYWIIFFCTVSNLIEIQCAVHQCFINKLTSVSNLGPCILQCPYQLWYTHEKN